MTKKSRLILTLAIALVLSGGIYAYAYTTATGTINIAEPTGDIATSEPASNPPDWESILPIEGGLSVQLDQNNPNQDDNWGVVHSNYCCAQTFFAAVTGDLTQITLYLKKVNNPGNLTIEIRDCDGPDSPPWSTTLATITTSDVTSETGQEYDFIFDPPTPITIDTYYAIVLREQGGGAEEDQYQWAGYGDSDIYALGKAWLSTNGGLGWMEAGGSPYDFYFRTYIESEIPPVISGEVPTGDLFVVSPHPDYSGDLVVKTYLLNTADLNKAYQHLNMKLYMAGSVEAGETPNFRPLTLENGVATFNLEAGGGGGGPTTATWTQTSQADFEAGTPVHLDTTTSPGDVKLATISESDTVTDTFDDETMIASKSNLVVSGGQVTLTSDTGGTETLRPDGAGDETDISIQYPEVGDHWDKVDEESPDSDATYVATDDNSWEEDLYDLPSHTTGSGSINYVKVHMVCKAAADPSQPSAYIHIKTEGAEHNGSSETLTTSYAVYSHQWNTNPETGEAWTWDEIDALQIGVGLRRARTGGPPFQRHALCTQVYAEVDYSGGYNSPGILTSTNLLSGETVAGIDSFGYNASAIPSGTNLKVQFSQDNATWYNSAGSAGGWDTLSQGTHSINLSGLGWSGANFYYRMEFTSDGTDTPVLDEISVTYTPSAGYYTSGTLTSSAHDTGGADSFNTIAFTINEPAGTDIKFQIRTAATQGGLGSAAWYGPTGTSDYYTSSGSAINPVHDGDQWVQYKVYFAGPGDSTPTLSDVSITYTIEGGGPSEDYIISINGGSYALISGDTSEWEPGWSVTPELYCEVTQR